MKLKSFILLTIFLCNLNYGISQTTDFIRGTLKDKRTNDPIEYASIGITNSLLGTAGNENGEFTLKIDNQSKHERIKISCIGYLTRTLSIDSIVALNNDNVTIHLDPDIALLDEVIIKSAPINPAEIIESAIRSVNKNYSQQPFNLELFSTINANDSVTKQLFKIETVLMGYYQGYNSLGNKKFEIIHKRTTGEDPLPRWCFQFKIINRTTMRHLDCCVVPRHKLSTINFIILITTFGSSRCT